MMRSSIYLSGQKAITYCHTFFEDGSACSCKFVQVPLRAMSFMPNFYAQPNSPLIVVSIADRFFLSCHFL
jgi:hypothetical protein